MTKPAPRRVDDEEDEDSAVSRKRATSPWVIAVPLAAAVAMLAFWAGRHGAVEKKEDSKPAVAATPAGPDASVAGPSEPALADLVPVPKVPARLPTPRADPTPAPSVVPPKADPAAPTAMAKGEPAILEIAVDPPVDVAIDGRAAGRTPLKADVAVGAHKLTFTDAALGVQLVRAVKAKPGVNSVSFSLGRGSVTVACPAGAEVRIDNRVVGTTPLAAPINVMAGNHRIQVSKGGARWQQVFSVEDGERMNFDVEIQGDP